MYKYTLDGLKASILALGLDETVQVDIGFLCNALAANELRMEKFNHWLTENGYVFQDFHVKGERAIARAEDCKDGWGPTLYFTVEEEINVCQKRALKKQQRTQKLWLRYSRKSQRL